MNDRFFGTFDPVLDSKNRVTVPAAWRDSVLGNLMSFFEEEDGVIWLMDREELIRLGQSAIQLAGEAKALARSFRELLYSTSVDCPVDAQGRVVLPAAQLARLGVTPGANKIVLVGVGPRIVVRRVELDIQRKQELVPGYKQMKEVLDL